MISLCPFPVSLQGDLLRMGVHVWRNTGIRKIRQDFVRAKRRKQLWKQIKEILFRQSLQWRDQKRWDGNDRPSDFFSDIKRIGRFQTIRGKRQTPRESSVYCVRLNILRCSLEKFQHSDFQIWDVEDWSKGFLGQAEDREKRVTTETSFLTLDEELP